MNGKQHTTTGCNYHDRVQPGVQQKKTIPTHSDAAMGDNLVSLIHQKKYVAANKPKTQEVQHLWLTTQWQVLRETAGLA